MDGDDGSPPPRRRSRARDAEREETRPRRRDDARPDERPSRTRGERHADDERRDRPRRHRSRPRPAAVDEDEVDDSAAAVRARREAVEAATHQRQSSRREALRSSLRASADRAPSPVLRPPGVIDSPAGEADLPRTQNLRNIRREQPLSSRDRSSPAADDDDLIVPVRRRPIESSRRSRASRPPLESRRRSRRELLREERSHSASPLEDEHRSPSRAVSPSTSPLDAIKEPVPASTAAQDADVAAAAAAAPSQRRLKGRRGGRGARSTRFDDDAGGGDTPGRASPRPPAAESEGVAAADAAAAASGEPVGVASPLITAASALASTKPSILPRRAAGRSVAFGGPGLSTDVDADEPEIQPLDFFTSTNFFPEPEPTSPPKRKRRKPRPDHEALDIEPAEGDNGNAGDGAEEDSEEEVDEEFDFLQQVVDGGYIWKQMSDLTHEPLTEYITEEELYEQWDKILQPVSSLHLPLDERLGGKEVRFLEDEGFFVGVPPPMPLRQLHRLERRLLLAGGPDSGWFGVDGQLLRLPDPVDPFPKKLPFLWLDTADERRLDTLWAPAALMASTEEAVRNINALELRMAGDIEASDEEAFQLDVDVARVQFSLHPLFIEEDVLATRLTALCQQDEDRRQQRLVEHLSDKLVTQRHEALRLQQQVEADLERLGDRRHPPGKDELAQLERNQRRLRQLRLDIKQTRSQRDSEEQADVALLGHILKTWKQLKVARLQQGFTSTPVSLVVYKKETDREADKRVLARRIRDEMEDMAQEFADLQREQVREFRETHARQRLERRQGAVDEEGHGGQEEQEEEAELPRELQRSFDRQEAKRQVKSRLRQFVRPPGTPIMQPELHVGAEVTPTMDCTFPEKVRRESVLHYEVFVQVLFNGKVVCRTPIRPLRSDFSAVFGEVYSIRISQWPQSISFQIWEAGRQPVRREVMLAEVFVPVPASSVTAAASRLDEIEFSSERRAGLQIPASGGGAAAQQQPMSGLLYCKAGWGMTSEGFPMAPPQPHSERSVAALQHMDALNAIGAAGVIDPSKLSEWINSAGLDPNDPRNTLLLSAVQSTASVTTALAQQGKFFRLTGIDPIETIGPDGHTLALDTQAGRDLPKRMRLMLLRAKQVPEFRSYGPIPMYESEVTDGVLDRHNEEIRLEMEYAREQAARFVDFRETALSKFLENVRKNQQELHRKLQQRITLPEVVNEESLPNLGTVGQAIKALFAPYRPLRPKRKPRKVVAPTDPDECKILVRVVRAFDVPVRVDETTSDRRADTARGLRPTGSQRRRNVVEVDANLDQTVPARFELGQTGPLDPLHSGRAEQFKEGAVRPFVEVVFQHEARCTSVGYGPNPSFNEELELPFRPPNNSFAPDNLQRCADELYFNVFDEVVVDILEDQRQRETNLHQRREKRWLGTFSVPFATVYANQRVEGTFKVEVPAVLLGYNRNLAEEFGADLDEAQRELLRTDTYLTVFITIDPPLRVLPPTIISNASVEDSQLLSYANYWLNSLERKFPNRELRATAQDINGMSVFIGRYIRRQFPPAGLVEDDLLGPTANLLLAMRRLARFVSLIPFFTDSSAFIGNCDLWTTTDQFLQMLGGDHEEHAVFLCNLFRSLTGVRAWVVIGRGIPEGETAYVLSQADDGKILLWDPVHGNEYDVFDHHCPLQAVGMIFNADNLWANVQAYDSPSRMSWDLLNHKAWKPFFTSKFSNPGLSSVQVERLQYVETTETNAEDLRASIDQEIRSKMESWRGRFPTRWNRYCSSVLQEVAATFEEAAVQRSGTGSSAQAALEKIRTSYEMTGFPLNMRFASMRNIIEAVHNTRVHKLEDKDTEFALAVHVNAYPNNIFSVWIYIAGLHRKA